MCKRKVIGRGVGGPTAPGAELVGARVLVAAPAVEKRGGGRKALRCDVLLLLLLLLRVVLGVVQQRLLEGRTTAAVMQVCEGRETA